MGGSQVRQACHWIPKPPARADFVGGEVIAHDLLKHPDLMAALRGIDRYDTWVNERLLPIVGKWIDEHRDEIVPHLSEGEMDDMGAAVEAAYKLLVDQGWIDERRQEAESVQADESRHNQSWVARTRRMLDAEG